jgi:hypothetical protein
MYAASDIRKSVEYASLISSTPRSMELFLEFAKAEVFEILSKHRSAVQAIADALVEHGTLNGAEVDDLISQAVARDALEAEKSRRLEWHEIERRAAAFQSTHAISHEDKNASTQ